MQYTNKRVLLKSRPEGLPSADAWQYDTETITSIPEGHFLVEQHYISLDPAMRGWMRNQRSYIPPVELGAVMRAGSVGKVVASKNPSFAVGESVVGTGGVQQYALSDGKGWNASHLSDQQLPKALSVLGMTGFTAYFGLLEVGKPEPGNTVLISGATGAVGSIVGQIAKIKGCRVVGIAGGPEKTELMLQDLHFDAAIDYKQGSVQRDIRSACPQGVDVYFDNVGGEILDAALANLAPHARVVICGAISQYNESSTTGPSNYMSLLVNRATMAGFVVFDYAKRYREASQQLQAWIQSGQLQSQEDIYEGIENFHETFLRLFSGEKSGKLVLKVLE